jgi:hypothetical protein
LASLLLVYFRIVAAELVEVQPVPHDEVAALQSTELEVDLHCPVGPLDEHCRVDPAGVEALEQFDELLESVAGVVHVLDHQQALALIVLGTNFSFDLELAGGVEASVRFNPHEVVAVVVPDLLDQVGVEHEGALEDAQNNEIEAALLRLDLIVIGVDLASYPADDAADGLLVVEQLEIESLMGLC